jgi:DNA repair photolyase
VSQIVTLSEKKLNVSEEDYLSLLKKNHNLTLIKNTLESILNKKTKGKMFNIVSRTWNPVTGCLYNCNYCWARNLAITKLQNSHRYLKGFKPSLNEAEFRSKFGKGDLVFVSDMGDLFGDFIPDKWIARVLDKISDSPEADFLLMTKNPQRYYDFLHCIPKNAILGVTIETNNDEIVQIDKVSTAPLPSERYNSMKNLAWDRKLVSIEPILDFDLKIFKQWIEDIYPFLLYVGYDNYGHKLREPIMKNTLNLISVISENTLVIKKTIRPAWFEDTESCQSNLPEAE